MRADVFYMSGAGNLFTVMEKHPPMTDTAYVSHLAPQLCDATTLLHKHTEGLMLIAPPLDESMDFSVDFFNPDGSTSMMCGNGSRCAVRFAQKMGLIPSNGSVVRFRMAGALYSAISTPGDIAVTFPPPLRVQHHLPIEIDGISFEVSYVNVGSDHAVAEEEQLQRMYRTHGKEYHFEHFAPALRHHPAFERGANANLYNLRDGVVHLRTFERGVEAVTGACGTGAIATALCVWQQHHLPPQNIRIIPPSTQALVVSILYNDAQQKIDAIVLCGGAEFLGSTEVELKEA